MGNLKSLYLFYTFILLPLSQAGVPLIQRQSSAVTVPRVGDWVSLGCYTDNVNGRALTATQLSVPNTIEACTSACFAAGKGLSGTEFSGECYCGSSIVGGNVPATLSDCNMPCSGNATEACGGPNRLNVYQFNDTGLPVPPPPIGPVRTGLPSSWHYASCYVDNAHGRVFEDVIGATPGLTVESCINICISNNFTVAGMEFGDECYCGNRLIAGAVTAPDADCSMACDGNKGEACGAGNRLSVYTVNPAIQVLPVPTIPKTNLTGQWTYHGCLVDAGNARILQTHNVWLTNATVEACLSQCQAFGYDVAGLEFAQECWCGGLETLQNPTIAPDSDCNTICTGSPIELCGAGNRLQTYTWTGGLNVFHQPANIGRYEFFVPGVVVPLLATLGINNKVTFLEKHGTSEFDNSTGAYELDLSLTKDFSHAWREMHVKTDVFCSGSIILPDKGGRQINVGGWSEDSTFGIRFYTPNGSPGINGTNDWEENFQEIKLQRGRWYPTASMLANGSILVIGGEIGSNDVNQPNLEILPKPDGGDTVVDLPWLDKEDKLESYPFVFILPSGRVFVAYYNEARILDPVTFETIVQMPNIPGAVDNFLGGRTYPLQGAAVAFPLSAPYTDLMTIVICGGSTPQPSEPLDNCVSIQPEAQNPTWTIERMPSVRVMPNMVPLPDGSFLIVNGAKAGQAGFGLANTPNLQALLYNPLLPKSQRISILNTTIIPRLYHSEAILLPDGRVLVSGSDPQTDGFAEEMRIEVYVPPYLNEGKIQPSFVGNQLDWEYGGQYTIQNVVLHQGTKATMKVSLVGAVSSTHGNAMGARTIFPAFTCASSPASNFTCTITAPPNANISPPGWHQLFILDGPTPSRSVWVRIGGDPAGLGSWPSLPGFNPPGV